MQSVVVRLVHYNSAVNKKLFDLLESVPESILQKSVGSYYNSIVGLLNHVLRSDLAWLGRFREPFPDRKMLQSTVVELPTGMAAGSHIHEDLPSLRARRFELDLVFVQFVESLSPAELAREFTYRNARGVTLTNVIEDILLHLFNHQTHHRGAISQILDSENIEHDISSYIATRG
ncbi:MAG TPA: DinB family protein [Spirochaetia bacterium]|nr:DinB family protein [Spirochaetia bacterium]